VIRGGAGGLAEAPPSGAPATGLTAGQAAAICFRPGTVAQASEFRRAQTRDRGLLGVRAAALRVIGDHLGLSSAELLTRLREGKSLADIAEAQRSSATGLEQAILAGAKARLEGAVVTGRLSVEREQAILDRLESKLPDLVSQSWRGGAARRAKARWRA
jgi:hypothetical protein